MKYVSIFSVTLKSAITPSFIGLIATTLPGVRPSMSFASRPTATTSPLILLIATMEGSFTTIPLPCENTNVFAVPKSIARSDENRLNTDLRLYPFLFITASPCGEDLARQELRVRPPNSPSSIVAVFAGPRKTANRRLPVLLGHHDRDLLLGRATPAVRANHHDGVLARFQGLRKMPEHPIRRNVCHWLCVDDQRSSRFCSSDDLCYPSVNLRAHDLQQHLLRFALRYQRELERFAEFAGLFLCVRGRHVPEIISRFEAAHLRVRSCHFHFFHQLREHVRWADAQGIAHCIIHGLPFEMDFRGLRILRNDRRQVQRNNQPGRRQHVHFLRWPSAREAHLFPLREFDLLVPTVYFRLTRRNHDFMLVLLRVVFYRRAAVLLHERGCILHAHRRLRVTQGPRRRCQVHRARVDAHRRV